MQGRASFSDLYGGKLKVGSFLNSSGKDYALCKAALLE